MTTTSAVSVGRRARRRHVVATSATFAALALLVGVAWWWTHPSFFEPADAGMVLDPRPVERAALAVGVTAPSTGDDPTGTITLTSVRAIFDRNTADASTDFSVCHLDEGEDPIGATHDASADCADLEPFTEGMSFEQGSWGAGDYLVVTVVPSRPGVAHLTGVELAYQRGADGLFRRGRQLLPQDVVVRAR